MAEVESYRPSHVSEKKSGKTTALQIAGLTLALGLAKTQTDAIETVITQPEPSDASRQVTILLENVYETGLPIVTGGFSEIVSEVPIGITLFEHTSKTLEGMQFFEAPHNLIQSTTDFIGDQKDSAKTRELLRLGLSAAVAYTAAGSLLYDIFRRDASRTEQQMDEMTTY